jgi:FKBP-type peptidyl-prolyl cis-trans isomerase 2
MQPHIFNNVMVMDLIKFGDFIKIEYTGYDERGNVFDSTSGEVAKTLHGSEGPLVVIFGVDRLPKGLEETLRQMNKQDEIDVMIPPEKAFGKPKKSLIKVLPTSYFKHQKLTPSVGLPIYIDTDNGRIFGVIKSVSNGRVVVDFNHPLAGKKVRYKIKLVDIINDGKEKIEALLARYGLKGAVSIDSSNLLITLSKKGETNEYETRKLQLLTLIKQLFTEIKNISINEVD